MTTSLLRAALAAAAVAALGGCVVAPLGPYRGGTYTSEYGPVVDAAPPPLQVEVPPPAPAYGYVWIGGYWGWYRGRHTWIGGRWAQPPSGHAWVPGYWGRHERGWRWREGYWGRR